MSNKRNIPTNQTTTSRILEVAGRLSVPSGETKENAWKKLGLKESKHIYLSRRWISRAAAVIVMAVLSFSAVELAKVDITTAKGEHRTIVLPDKSEVRLNADSFVSYNTLLWKFYRSVSFNGEGIFKVTKGSTFEVSTTSGSIKVLGTSFDVLNRNNLFRVACITGSVQVEALDSSVVLVPGQNTSRSERGLAKPTSFDQKILAWERGEFYFSNTPLSEVAEELERQFNIQIELDTSKERFYTGYFNNKDLDEALKLVCVPLGLSYEMPSARRVKIINYEINV